MSTSSVPPIQWTPAGIVLPSEADILAGVQADINAAFGGGVNPALETPQGQIASSEAAVIAEKNSEIAYIVNQVDPQYSSDRFQDAIGRIYFLDRKPATSTVVACTLTGLTGTVVPAGTLAQDTSKNTYILLGNATIGGGGTVTGTSWANIVTGPIACPSGTLVKVYQSVPGWDLITNPADGVLGQNVESRSEFEFRRQNSVALNGRGTCPSIYANVFNVANVLDCYVIDNPSDLTILKGSTNYPLSPHSIFVAAVGGVDADIAQAIWNKKDVGADYSPYPVGGSPVPGDGSVSTTTILDTSGYSFPQPSYQVSFLRPGALPIKFAVQIVNDPTLPANIADLVKAAIVAQFNGTNGSTRERIGSLILATRYYAPIAAVGQNVLLVSVLLGPVTATLPDYQVGIDQVPTLSLSDISVTLV
jgi:hypothetical protein